MPNLEEIQKNAAVSGIELGQVVCIVATGPVDDLASAGCANGDSGQKHKATT